MGLRGLNTDIEARRPIIFEAPAARRPKVRQRE
jgi:hypothetical protein